MPVDGALDVLDVLDHRPPPPSPWSGPPPHWATRGADHDLTVRRSDGSVTRHLLVAGTVGACAQVGWMVVGAVFGVGFMLWLPRGIDTADMVVFGAFFGLVVGAIVFIPLGAVAAAVTFGVSAVLAPQPRRVVTLVAVQVNVVIGALGLMVGSGRRSGYLHSAPAFALLVGAVAAGVAIGVVSGALAGLVHATGPDE